MSPAGYVAVSFALVVYLSFPPSTIVPAAAGFSLFLSASGLVLLCTDSAAVGRFGFRCISLTLGLLLGAFFVVERNQDSAFVGLPLSTITEYEIRLTDDTLRAAGRSTLYRGILLSVSSREDATATARGSVLVVGGTKAFEWGAVVKVHGNLKRGLNLGADWMGRAVAVEPRPGNGTGWYFGLRNRARGWVKSRLSRMGTEDAPLFMALFLGSRDDLGDAESFFFRRAGAIHLLALSGFHLGILSFILIGLLSPLMGKTRAVVLAVFGLVIYLFVAGPKVSLFRAVVMFGMLGFCRFVGLRARGLDVLGFSFLLSALVQPSSLTTLSFQLSYLALGGIMLLSPPFQGLFTTWMPKVLRFPIAAAIGAQLLTAPILISRFGLLYPIGLLSGLVLTPLVTAFMWGGLALVFLPLPERFARLGSEVLGVVHHVLSAAAEFFARANPVRTGDWGSAILLAVVVLVLLRMPSAVRFLRLKRKEIDLFGPEHPGRRM